MAVRYVLIPIDGVVGEPARALEAGGLSDGDRDALARMHEDYLRCGIRERDDTGYLRQFQPDFEALKPRW